MAVVAHNATMEVIHAMKTAAMTAEEELKVSTKPVTGQTRPQIRRAGMPTK